MFRAQQRRKANDVGQLVAPLPTSENKFSEGIDVGIVDKLHKIIGVCNVCFKNPSFYTVVSIPLEWGEVMIPVFCEMMIKVPDQKLVCLQR